MIEHILRFAMDPSTGPELQAAIQDLIDSASRGDRNLVSLAETAVRADPSKAFTFDTRSFAILQVGAHQWLAGRFETPTIAELRQRAGSGNHGGRLRLWVLDGAGAATEIGGLQATAGPGSLFQAASQFNCLESPGPYVTEVAKYFYDKTQGPRASISAFPATLLRHYAAPRPDGSRFVQSNSDQLNLLADAFGPELARVQSGYLMAENVRDPDGLIRALTTNFEQIRVGVHEGAEVLLGYDFGGSVNGQRRISQVFTSTVAGGGYGGRGLNEVQFRSVCRQLLRAAYLGTLLAAVCLRQKRAVLTLIGGGVFGNPIPLIWDSICWAAGEVEPYLAGDLDVVVNGRNLGEEVDDSVLLEGVQKRGGAVLRFRGRDSLPVKIDP